MATILSIGFYNNFQEPLKFSKEVQNWFSDLFSLLKTSTDIRKSSDATRKPKFWFHEKNSRHKLFESVENVLERLGLEKIEMNLSEIHNDWDLIWSYQLHPLENLNFDWKSLKYHQKINHIPGKKGFKGV